MYKAGNLGQEIGIFVKRHRMICVLSLLSLFVIFKNSAIPAPDWLPSLLIRIFAAPEKGTSGAEWLSLMNNLSLAFIGSMITYIIIQYIPERRKAYKAFSILKSEICRLYSYMSYLIGMYLFVIGFEGEEKDVTVAGLKDICNIEIMDQDHLCCIEHYRNGNKANARSFSYNLYKDSKNYIDLIQKSIDTITGTMCAGDLDSELLDILSRFSNNRFLQYFSYLDVPQLRIPGTVSYIVAFDKGFYEFVQNHVRLQKYDFDIITYAFGNITEEEIAKEKEEQLFYINRLSIKYTGVKKAKDNIEQIITLPPTAEIISKCVGIILELLVYYDFIEPKPNDILDCALELAEYVRNNEMDPVKADYALLNVMQIKKRMNMISDGDLVELQQMKLDTDKDNNIIIGASILCGDYGRAANAFDVLSQEEKESFIQFPIYRLWQDPPIPANKVPKSFSRMK